MNIFILDNDIQKNVQYYCNKHCIKMILESVQILCTILNERELRTTYKSTHKNHPCVKWANESYANFYYLYELIDNLNIEYKHRFNKIIDHKSFTMLNTFFEGIVENPYILWKFINSFPTQGQTPFVQCMPDQYKCDDPVQAYRNYYIGEKQHIAKWTKRNIPEWFIFR